jgi:ferrous iron transport protein B
MSRALWVPLAVYGAQTATNQGQSRTLMMELPNYTCPILRNVCIGLWQRVVIFGVGGVILVLTIALWFLASFPERAAGRDPPTQ